MNMTTQKQTAKLTSEFFKSDNKRTEICDINLITDVIENLQVLKKMMIEKEASFKTNTYDNMVAYKRKITMMGFDLETEAAN